MKLCFFTFTTTFALLNYNILNDGLKTVLMPTYVSERQASFVVIFNKLYIVMYIYVPKIILAIQSCMLN